MTTKRDVGRAGRRPFSSRTRLSFREPHVPIDTAPTAAATRTTKYVYDFTEGNKDLKDLLGGKGANLAEMTNLGLPVPPGFTLTTEACRAYLADGDEPEGLRAEVSEHLAALEDRLLVSVRSGAKFSMPGMMETVLNIGLSDSSVQGLANVAGDERFA